MALPATGMTIDRIDHFVLTVRDVAATCDFYVKALGMEVVTFGAGRTALRFGIQKINLHPAGPPAAGVAMVAGQPTPGSGDFCLITERSIDETLERLRAAGVTIEQGPVTRSGALGPIESIYFRDPDGNLVEVSRYARSAAEGDEIAPLREWLSAFAAHVRAIDFAGGKAMCAPDMLAFGTYAGMVERIEDVMNAQWYKIWPTIKNFSIRTDEARGGISGDTAWVAAPWDSLGTNADGTTYDRPGRLTMVFVKRDGRWLARHTHLSLVPNPRRTTGTETP
jgi:catechol 2,3-dioxygenase-like lactoylglutathione lyase family enzyme/ketosteroid isomerase-like protein